MARRYRLAALERFQAIAVHVFSGECFLLDVVYGAQTNGESQSTWCREVAWRSWNWETAAAAAAAVEAAPRGTAACVAASC